MWDWLVAIIYEVLKFIQTYTIDWGLAIIILTVIIRLILTPLQNKSLKSSARMQVLQPKMKEIQERYEGDPERMNKELQKFYAENSFNPFSGCLPLLLQMPVFFALFSVLRDKVPVAASFFNIIPSLGSSPQNVFEAGVGVAWPYLLLMLGFGILTMVPQLIMSRNQTGSQASQMRITSVVMGVFMIFISWPIPAGVLLYYNTSAIWGLIQQLFVTRKVMEKARAEEEARLASAPIEVNVVRHEKKARPHKKN